MYEKITKILENKEHYIVSGKDKSKANNLIEDEEKTLKRIFSDEKHYVNNLIDFTYDAKGELLKITITVREEGLYGFKHYYYIINF